MPYRINGIGTGYYGKQNREEYHGMCEYCGRAGVMQNYETRLWFSLVFIPVIPLGRKQILDYCSYCTRHKALNVAEWERIKSEAIQQSGDQLAENQDDPEAAVNMHLTLAAFHKNEEAARLADIMREKFGDDAQVQLYLAGWYEGQGKTEQMRATIDRAWALDPDNPAVRRAVGMTQIENGQLEKARQTLSVMEPPSPNYDASVFYTLAKGYQKAQEHAQALEIFQMILEATPKAADEKEFPSAVRESEKTLARPKSILPAKSPISGSAIGWTAVLLLVAAGIGFWNYFLSTHRTLFVVNGLAAPITVEITDADNQPVNTVKVDPNVGWAVKIPEGTYHAQVTSPQSIAPQSEPVDFTISSGWWERFFREPAYVIDPSRSAFVVWQQTTYIAKPQNANLGGESFALHIGKPFTTYPDVDFLFQPFPAEVKVSDRTREVTKTRVGLEVVTPALLPQQNSDQHTPEEWLGYLERHLTVSPGDQMLLGSYTLLASQHDQWDRCLKFLRSRLGDRPVNVEWHRAYQQSSELAGQADGLPAEYDGYLKQDSNNSDLLYLRGRLCARVSETLAFLDRAIAQDDKNTWALGSKGYSLLAQGRFDEAKAVIEKARKLDPDNGSFEEFHFNVRLATRDFAGLEQELQSAAGGEGSSSRNGWRQALLAKAQGKREEVQKAYDVINQPLPEGFPQKFIANFNSRKVPYLLLLDQFDKAADMAEALPAEGIFGSTRIEAYLLSGRLEEAAKQNMKVLGRMQEGYYQLCLSLAYQQQGENENAETWKERAIESLNDTGESERFLAGLLKKAKTEFPTDEELADIISEPRWKAVALCLLIPEADADRKPKLLELAKKLNFEMSFPHQLIAKAAGG